MQVLGGILLPTSRVVRVLVHTKSIHSKPKLCHPLHCQIVWPENLFSLVLRAMAAASFSVCGAVQLSQGGALIHLNPIPNAANPASPPMRRPSPDELLTRMKAGEVVCHPCRKEMDVKQVTNMLNTIQRNLYLRTGANGEWNQACDGRLHAFFAHH